MARSKHLAKTSIKRNLHFGIVLVSIISKWPQNTPTPLPLAARLILKALKYIFGRDFQLSAMIIIGCFLTLKFSIKGKKGRGKPFLIILPSHLSLLPFLRAKKSLLKQTLVWRLFFTMFKSKNGGKGKKTVLTEIVTNYVMEKKKKRGWGGERGFFLGGGKSYSPQRELKKLEDFRPRMSFKDLLVKKKLNQNLNRPPPNLMQNFDPNLVEIKKIFAPILSFLVKVNF